MWRHARLSLLDAMAQAAAQTPDLCRNERAAVEREQARARAAPDLATYLAGAPDFALARAAVLDVAKARMQLAVAFDDPWELTAAHAEHAATVAARDEAAFTATVGGGLAVAVAARAERANVLGAFGRLMPVLIGARATPNTMQRRDIDALIEQMNVDAEWDAGLTPARYRHRLPWLARADVLTRWLVEVGAPQPGLAQPWRPLPSSRVAREPVVAATEGDVVVADVGVAAAATVHANAEAAPAEHAAEDYARQAALREPASLTAHAPEHHSLLTRARTWHEPVLVDHLTGLANALPRTQNSTQRTSLLTYAADCLHVEANWNAVFFAPLVPAVTALASTWRATHHEQQRDTETEDEDPIDPRAALAVCRELTGGMPLDLIRLRDALLRSDFLHAPIGVSLGEDGHVLVQAIAALPPSVRAAIVRDLLATPSGNDPPLWAWGQQLDSSRAPIHALRPAMPFDLGKLLQSGA